MSAGPFIRTFYENNGGGVHPIRLQPDTLAAVFGTVDNDPPAGPATFANSAKVSGSRRQLGLNARFATVVFTATPPAGYKVGGYYRIVVPSESIYANITPFQSGTYLGVAMQVISTTDETVN